MEIQGTKPHTLSYALVDSPLGMLAWIRDKLHHLVDDDYIWADEDVITWAMVILSLMKSLSESLTVNSFT